jgi:cardiolipin synthase (CMP-forming)
MVPDATPGPEMPAMRSIAQRPAVIRLDLTLPNLITLARLLSVPAMIWLIIDARYAVAFWVFVGAGVSDGLDGYVAKRFDRRTPLGALLDPIADKAMLASLYITLGLAGQLPAWLVIVVVLRDLSIVIGFALLHAVAAAPRLGPLAISKINTLAQIALAGYVLAQLAFWAEDGTFTGLLIAAVAATTVLSGASYLLRWTRIMSGST